MTKKIVVIGGGSGLSVLLTELKNYTKELTAIVTVSDDGGGSGKLRADLGMLPPGDIRANLLALSNTRDVMEKLLNFRFHTGELKGQSFGNLLLAAMNEIYGDFGIAVRKTGEVLNITGRVLPATLDQMDLVAELENGKKFLGESAIPKFSKRENSPIKRMHLENSEVNALEDCLEAIEQADLIVLGPGSLYTSVIPNLLIKNMVEAIMEAEAKKVYICNVMTQSGETDGYGVYDHVKGILNHGRPDMLDYCIANSKKLDSKESKRYIIEDSVQVLPNEVDEKKLSELSIKLLKGSYIDVRAGYIRSDAKAISETLLDIIYKRT